MPKELPISTEEKVRVVIECIEGRKSHIGAAAELGVSRGCILYWISKYESEGVLGLVSTKKNRGYSEETKTKAVIEYLSGAGSQEEICKKYKIRSSRQLRNWIKVYNSGRDFKHKMNGGSRMKNTRKTTQEERIRIAKECIENGYNYGDTAIKYQVSYQQVYTWVKKFAEKGDSGLEDRRGQRTAQQEPRTEEEKLRIRVAQLEHELYMTKMERDLLKKLEEIERRDAYRK